MENEENRQDSHILEILSCTGKLNPNIGKLIKSFDFSWRSQNHVNHAAISGFKFSLLSRQRSTTSQSQSHEVMKSRSS